MEGAAARLRPPQELQAAKADVDSLVLCSSPLTLRSSAKRFALKLWSGCREIEKLAALERAELRQECPPPRALHLALSQRRCWLQLRRRRLPRPRLLRGRPIRRLWPKQ